MLYVRMKINNHSERDGKTMKIKRTRIKKPWKIERNQKRKDKYSFVWATQTLGLGVTVTAKEKSNGK